MPITIIHKYVKIDTLYLDAAVTEQYEYSSKVTQYPVETGAMISDNIFNEPVKVTIHGVFSNHVMPMSPNYIYGKDNAEFAFYELMKLRDNRVPVTLVTGLSSYPNMVLQNLSIPRNVKNTDALEFTATFIRVTFVNSQIVPQNNLKTVKGVNKQAATQKPNGKQTATNVPTGPLYALAKAVVSILP